MKSITFGGEQVQYLYLLSDDRCHKIGISRNPEKRLLSLKTGNPHLRLLDTWLVLNGRRSELAVQRYFSRAGRRINESEECFLLQKEEVEFLRDLDDPGMNSWIRSGCQSMFDDSSAPVPAMFTADGENAFRVFRIWFVPEPETLIEVCWTGIVKPPRATVDQMWQERQREVLLTSVIRKRVTVCGESMLVVMRAVGNWRTTQTTEAMAAAMVNDHEEATTITNSNEANHEDCNSNSNV